MDKIKVIKDPVVKKADAIKAAGKAVNISRALGISRASVSEWGEFVPPYRARQLVELFPQLKQSDPS